jgi:hypothetical protein
MSAKGKEKMIFICAAKAGELSLFRSCNAQSHEKQLLLAVDEKFNRSIYHWAAQGGHIALLLQLLFCPAHAELISTLRDSRDRDGKTALAIAVKNCHLEAVQCLLAAGFDINVSDNNGCVALDHSQNTAISKLLTEERAPICMASDHSWGLIVGPWDNTSLRKGKCIGLGWYLNPAGDVDSVIFKCSEHYEDLEKELLVRRTLLSTCPPNCHKTITRAMQDSVLTLPQSTLVSKDWFAIILEKADVDLHGLLVKCHGSGRCPSLMSKIELSSRLLDLGQMIDSCDFVYYDMKPSNVLVFFPIEVVDRLETGRKRHHDASFPDYNILHNIYSFQFKVNDLSSCVEKGVTVDGKSISCTAKFIAPEVSRCIKRDQRFVASSSSFIWSLGITIMQILHPNYQTFCSSIELSSSAEIYNFYNLKSDEEIQLRFDVYIESLFEALRLQLGTGTGTISTNNTNITVNNLMNTEVLNTWNFWVKRMLRVDPLMRCSFEELKTLHTKSSEAAR